MQFSERIATPVSPLHSFPMFWKTTWLIFDRINQHNFTCHGEKQQKLASHGETAKQILEKFIL